MFSFLLTEESGPADCSRLSPLNHHRLVAGGSKWLVVVHRNTCQEEPLVPRLQSTTGAAVAVLTDIQGGYTQQHLISRPSSARGFW